MDKIEFKITGSVASAVHEDFNANVTLVLKEHPFAHAVDGYDRILCNRSAMQISARLSTLKAGHSPAKFVRMMLCVLLKLCVVAGRLNSLDIISLEASGAIDGSYIRLVQMYFRMGFVPYATMNIESDIMDDISNTQEPLCMEDGQITSTLMTVPLATLLSWCNDTFGVKPHC